MHFHLRNYPLTCSLLIALFYPICKKKSRAPADVERMTFDDHKLAIKY